MDKIYEILEDIKPEHDFHDSENFVEDGLLDSFDVISLVSVIEEELNIVIDGLDIVPENFISVETIAELIKRNGGSL